MAGKTVSPRYIPATVTVAAGTTAANPLTTNHILGDVVLEEIHLLIPDGHVGLTGISFLYSGERILPYGLGALWIIGNNEPLTFDLNFDVGNVLQSKAYNTDIFQHSFYLRFKVSDRDLAPARTTVSQLPL